MKVEFDSSLDQQPQNSPAQTNAMHNETTLTKIAMQFVDDSQKQFSKTAACCYLYHEVPANSIQEKFMIFRLIFKTLLCYQK